MMLNLKKIKYFVYYTNEEREWKGLNTNIVFLHIYNFILKTTALIL